MRYPSPADIAEMKARGYDRDTIEKAKEQSKRWENAQAVCSLIRTAFKGVILGNGVGLTEAQGLDDHEDPETCATYRANDEKEDWERISPDDLRACSSSLSFFDAEGMRFHLPAYLIADLEGEYGMGMAFSLTNIGDLGRRQFGLFNPEQRFAVRSFLLHIESEPDYQFERLEIRQALDTYWADSR